MGGKRKALNDEQFAKQTKKIRNPLVHQAHFHNVGESRVDVNTTTTGRQSLPRPSESSIRPMLLRDVASQQEPENERKNQTQVGLVIPQIKSVNPI
jgi:hypothetical protein